MNTRLKVGEPSRKLKWTLALSLLVILIGASAFLAVGGPAGLAKRPGILGTQANLFSDLNLIAQIILLVGLSLGAVLARRGNITAHQYNQTAWVLFNIVLTIFIMSAAYSANVLPGLPGNLNQAFALVSTIHAVLGLLAICCGVYLLLRMNKLIPKNWKRLMRLTLALYILVGVFGLGVYYFWYLR